MWFQIPSVVLALLAATTSVGNTLELDFSFTSCGCKFTPRSCLFIHGGGNDNAEKELQTSSTKFGDISDHAPCCSLIKYASLDTNGVGWTNEALQETVCNHALSMSSSSNVEEKVIKDTILVTHSMGALIVAGAVANKKCSIDKSTAWVSMSAPMSGTMASNYAQDICMSDNSKAFDAVLVLLGKCPVSTGMQSLTYMGGKYSTEVLNDAYKAAQQVYRKHVSAVMCSNANLGIISTDQPKYLLLGSAIQHGTNEHDGIVTYESCRGGLPASQFHDKPSGAFYVTTCNHADTAFLHGDGLLDSTKPVQWFKCLFSK